MALIPITTASVTDPFDSTQFKSVNYAVVDKFKLYDKAEGIVIFDLDIYSRSCESSERSELEIKPVVSYSYTVEGPDFTEFFSVAAITADDNHFKQAYLYLLQITDDENNLIWGSVWQGDE